MTISQLVSTPFKPISLLTVYQKELEQRLSWTKLLRYRPYTKQRDFHHLLVRERLLGRKVERHYLDAAQWKAAYAAQPPGPIRTLMAIGVAATECPEGMSLWAHWNARYLPQFRGTPLAELFPDVIEPFVAAMRASLAP